MKAQTVIAVVAALLVGVLLGYFVPQLTATTPEPEAKAVKATEKRRDRNKHQSDHDADLNRLRARIKQLERQLAEQDSAASEEPIEQPATNRVEGFRRFGPPSRAELEEMREKDPERYAQETNRITQFRADFQGRLMNQFDILESADTAHMTEKQRKVHEDYMSLLARIDELGEQLTPLADVTEDQRRAARQEMRETWHKLHELQRIERDTLLTQTANALGFRGRKAQEVVEGIKQVYEATGGGGHHGPPGGGPGGWGRHGGGRRGRR